MSDDSGPQPSPSFATLARRISAWTTRGLLTLMVLVAGFGLGRQVLRWWADDAAPASPKSMPAAGDSLGDPAKPHTVEFGDRPGRFGGSRSRATRPRQSSDCGRCAGNRFKRSSM